MKMPNKYGRLTIHSVVSYRNSTSRLCNVDFIRVRDDSDGRLSTANACGLG